MANRTHNLSLPAALTRIASSFARKQSLFAVWTIIAALLIQQSAIARISVSPSRDRPGLESIPTEAGTVFIDSNSGTKIVRVTDSRDGQARLASRVDSSSFNRDSSRFFVNLDGVPTLYAFDPSSLTIQKQGFLFGSLALQFDSCHWSAAEPDTIVGLGSGDSARIHAFDTRSGSNTLLRDFSDILPNGEAQNLSKSWSNDNHFAFTFRESDSHWRFGVVWDRTSDRVYLFDAADSVSGVPGFNDAHLDRSGEALIVNGDVTRVWRYLTQTQSDAVQLESAGDSRAMKTMAQENDAFDLFGSTRSANFPANDLSRDGRFSIFPSHTDGSRSDMFIAAVNVSATASSITWTHMVNCTAAANSLQKTGGLDQSDDAHATSTLGVLSGDAYVEFTAEEANKERWCGLNNSNAIHSSSNDINFAIKLANNKKALVVENGVVKAKIKYKPGNVLRVAVESGVVNYYKNGSVFYTSTASPAYPLLVNASLVDEMASISNVMISALTISKVMSISPAKASVAAGTTAQFTALVTGGNDTITWSATGGSVTNTGLYTAPATTGTFTLRASCTSSPNISASATVLVSTSFDRNPPVISGVNASNVTASGATVSWNTDEPSDTQIEYGPTIGYGALSTQNPSMVTSHSVAFGGLTPSTLYHFRVKSKDAAGNPGVSGDFTFRTLSDADTTPPLISAVSASNITSNSATISWTTNEASDTQVEYGTTTGYGSSSALNASMAASHTVSLNGLSANTSYHYRVKSKDAGGNLAVSADFIVATQNTAGDTTAPVISGVSASSITINSASITWSTNEASNTQVEYGTTSGYGSSTAINASLATSHSGFISGLSANTLYHYRVKSKDAAGNLAASGDFTFRTSTVSPPPPPPPSSGVITNRNIYSEPAAPALPRAGGTFVDPVFGTTIMRVTDENDGTSNTNYYSYWPTFNLDSTRFFIACDNNPRLYRFDPNNFQIISKGPLFAQTVPGGGYLSTEDAVWSGTTPNVLYGYRGLKLWAYDASAGTYALVKDFTGELPAGSLGQMSRSLDDNVFAFTKKNTNGSATGYAVWRRDQNRIVSNVSLGNLDEVQIDKSGRYLVVKAGLGGGVDCQVLDLQTGDVQSLTDGAPDYSPGHSDGGRGIAVGHDNYNNQYTVRNLSAPHQFQKVITFGNDWSQSNHVSMLADNEGWCLISNFTSGSFPVGPFRQEIFQASTDGSQNVRRLAHHHSVYRDYWDSPRGDISRDGRFVAFTSNWGSATRRDVFIIRVPQGSGSGGGSGGGAGDTTPPVISGVTASTSAVISWTTNEDSDTQVEYGTTTGYGSGTALNTSMVTGHSATLTGLSANTLYHYRVRSKDAAGNQAVSGDFSFTTPASGGGVGGGGGGGGLGSTQNVVWTGVVNCAVSGNSLQKTSGRNDDSDAGAASQQQIISGDGYVEFTVGVTGKMRFCGLTRTVSGTQYSAIDFAIKLTEYGVAEVRENNSYKSETTYTGSDLFRVGIVGGVVKYFKNGVAFYTSGRAPAYPLRADAAFLSLNGTVNNAVISAASGGSLAVSLRKSASADIADIAHARGQIVVSKNWWVELDRELMVGVTLPPSLRRFFALARI